MTATLPLVRPSLQAALSWRSKLAIGTIMIAMQALAPFSKSLH